MAKKNNSKQHRKKKVIKRTHLILLVSVSLLMIAWLAWIVSQMIIERNRITELKRADQTIQSFASQIENIDPNIQFQRNHYCRRDGVKYGRGPLRCITSVSINNKYTTEKDLMAAVGSLKHALRLQNVFPNADFRLSSDRNKSTIDSGGTRYYANSVDADYYYSFTHLDDPRSSYRGEFEYYVGFASQELQNPIYKLED